METTTGTGGNEATGGAPGSQRRSLTTILAAAAIPLAIGAFLGYAVAYQGSVGGLGGALGAAFLLLVIAAVLGFAVVVGVIALLVPNGRGRGVGSIAFAAAGLLGAGAFSGYALTPVLGLEYRAPVTLEARGTVTARLDGVAAFALRDSGPAECRSVPDSEAVSEVTALDLGELLSGTLRGTITLPQAGSPMAPLELWIDGADIASGAAQPFWSGHGEVTDLTERRTSGRVSFADTALQPSDKAGQQFPEGWPSTLSGELSWACGGWFDPSAIPGPPLEGRVELQLEAVSWSRQETGTTATCEIEPDGSVGSLTAADAGRLQGLPVRVTLDLTGEHRAGEEILLDIVLSGKNPTPELQFVPNWVGQIRLEEIATDDRSGSASFSDLPTGVDPSLGPPPAGWPPSLIGSIRWQCGG